MHVQQAVEVQDVEDRAQVLAERKRRGVRKVKATKVIR